MTNEAWKKFWDLFHIMALLCDSREQPHSFLRWALAFAAVLPCFTCRQHFLAALRFPLRRNAFAYSVDRHNDVSRRLGKHTRGVELAASNYGDRGGAAAQSSETLFWACFKEASQAAGANQVHAAACDTWFQQTASLLATPRLLSLLARVQNGTVIAASKAHSITHWADVHGT